MSALSGLKERFARGIAGFKNNHASVNVANKPRDVSGAISVKTREQYDTLVKTLSDISASNGFQLELFVADPDNPEHRGFPFYDTPIRFKTTHPIVGRQEQAFATGLAQAGFKIDNHLFYGTENGPFAGSGYYQIASQKPRKLSYAFQAEGYKLVEPDDYTPGEPGFSLIFDGDQADHTSGQPALAQA